MANRYTSARELSRALEAGLAGREPAAPEDELPTSMLGTVGGPTAATRRIDPDPVTPVAPQRAVSRRPPPQAPRRAAPAPPRSRPERSAASRIGRTIAALALIAILAAVIAAVVLLATDAGRETDVGQFLDDLPNDLPEVANEIEDFIRENTQ